MTTSCWITNESFECGWCRAGYGSRWDMLGPDDYYKGWWVSLEGLELLLYYDYELSEDVSPYGGKYYSVFWDHPSFLSNLERLKKISGGFIRENPNYRRRHRYMENEFIRYPSIEDLKNINMDHYNKLSRMQAINENAVASSSLINDWIGPVTREQYNQMREDANNFDWDTLDWGDK